MRHKMTNVNTWSASAKVCGYAVTKRGDYYVASKDGEVRGRWRPKTGQGWMETPERAASSEDVLCAVQAGGER